MTQLLDMRFGSRVMNYRITFGCHCRHDGILCCSDTGFIHEEICAAQSIGLKCKTTLILHIYTKRAQGKDMCVKTPTTDHISAGEGRVNSSKLDVTGPRQRIECSTCRP